LSGELRETTAETQRDGIRIGWLDLLAPYTHNSELQIIQLYCWFTHLTIHRYTRTRILSLY
jgi:hypothetical protein